MKLEILLLVQSWHQALKEQVNAGWQHSTLVFLVIFLIMPSELLHVCFPF